MMERYDSIGKEWEMVCSVHRRSYCEEFPNFIED